jgi:hypothetical protein
MDFGNSTINFAAAFEGQGHAIVENALIDFLK